MKLPKLKYFAKMSCLLVVFLLIFPATSSSIGGQNFSPYIEKFSNGWIDWDNGLIYGIGKGYLRKNKNIKSRARGAANLIAFGSILKLAAGINLDDKNVLKSLGKKETTIKLKAFVKAKLHSSKFVDDSAEPYFEVVKVASIKGIQGLSSKVLRYLNSTPWRKLPIKTNGGRLDDDEEPWLILDARELGFQDQIDPALFPKIVSSSGETIYSLEKVNDNAVIQRGMARYVVTDTPFYKFQSSSTFSEALLNKIAAIISVGDAVAQDNTRRKRRGRYIVKKVDSVQGLAKTNLVISQVDANKLKNEDMSSQILKKCRVIVVVSSPIGGIEGRLNNYYRQIANYLKL
jgi:hypothetical protein